MMPFIDHTAILERRQYPRIDGDFLALIRYTDRGNLEEHIVTLLNLSARGCFVALDFPLAERTKVFILTRISNEQHAEIKGPRLALRGIVVRVSCDDEPPGVGVRLTSHRFLSSDPQNAF